MLIHHLPKIVRHTEDFTIMATHNYIHTPINIICTIYIYIGCVYVYYIYVCMYIAIRALIAQIFQQIDCQRVIFFSRSKRMHSAAKLHVYAILVMDLRLSHIASGCGVFL